MSGKWCFDSQRSWYAASCIPSNISSDNSSSVNSVVEHTRKGVSCGSESIDSVSTRSVDMECISRYCSIVISGPFKRNIISCKNNCSTNRRNCGYGRIFDIYSETNTSTIVSLVSEDKYIITTCMSNISTIIWISIQSRSRDIISGEGNIYSCIIVSSTLDLCSIKRISRKGKVCWYSECEEFEVTFEVKFTSQIFV